MSKTKANSLLPMDQGIARLRSIRVNPSSAGMVKRIESLPKKLKEVVLSSFESFSSSYIVNGSEELFRLSVDDRRKIFTDLFPEYPEAVVEGLTNPCQFPTRFWYPYRAPMRPELHLGSMSHWWGTLALLRLEFPSLGFSPHELVSWAAYAGLSVENEDKIALGRLFANIIRLGGRTADSLLQSLKSALESSNPSTLPGSHVFVALWGSGDPESYRVLHRAMVDNRFAIHRADIFSSASRIEPGQLVPLLGLILENELEQDKVLLERFLDITSLQKILEPHSKKSERDKILTYLAKKLAGKPIKAIDWIDAWWEAWQAAIVDIDSALPLLKEMAASDDNQMRSAGLALAQEARVVDFLKTISLPKTNPRQSQSTSDLIQSLSAMASVKSKLPEEERKKRVVELAQLYEQVVCDEKRLNKLGKRRSQELLGLITGQLRRNWKDESLSIIRVGYKKLPFDLNFVIPSDYVIPDDATASLLIGNMKLDVDADVLYDDTCLNYEKTINAVLRSDLSPKRWISFIRRIHGKYLPLPPAVVEHLPKLPGKTITEILDTMSADRLVKSRIAALKVALSLKHTKHKALAWKALRKIAKPTASDSDEERMLKSELASSD